MRAANQITKTELQKMLAEQKKTPSKYRNKRVTVDGINFDSVHESGVWFKLKALEKSGKIRNLQRQVKYRLIVGGMQVCVYIADFVFEELQKTGEWTLVVGDAKGFATNEYKLKKSLMKGIHEIDIREY